MLPGDTQKFLDLENVRNSINTKINTLSGKIARTKRELDVVLNRELKLQQEINEAFHEIIKRYGLTEDYTWSVNAYAGAVEGELIEDE